MAVTNAPAMSAIRRLRGQDPGRVVLETRSRKSSYLWARRNWAGLRSGPLRERRAPIARNNGCLSFGSDPCGRYRDETLAHRCMEEAERSNHGGSL